MHEVKIYARDKKGNKGPLITTMKYPTKEQAERAKAAVIFLCRNQYRYRKEWSLKNAIIL